MTRLSRRTATTTRFSPKETDGAKVLPTSDQVGFYDDDDNNNDDDYDYTTYDSH